MFMFAFQNYLEHAFPKVRRTAGLLMLHDCADQLAVAGRPAPHLMHRLGVTGRHRTDADRRTGHTAPRWGAAGTAPERSLAGAAADPGR